MYKNILVPVDPAHGEVADRMVEVAKSLLDEGGQITVMSVIEPLPSYIAGYVREQAFQDRLKENRDAALGALQELLERTGVAHGKAILDEGSPSPEILRVAEMMKADAIVLGSSRKAPMSRFQEGTVAAEMLRSAHVPVALAPRGYIAPESGLSRVTCAIASSSHSLELARQAGRIAAGFHVPLRLATFIVRDRQMFPSGAGYDVENLVSNKFRAQADAVHEGIRASWQGTAAPQSAMGDGRTWKEAVADLGWQPDELLVIGSSRLGSLWRVFVGSNSGKILRHAPVPRMIVPRIAQ